MTDLSIDLFRERFREIKSMGFVRSRRSHDTGIGKTFEDLMGIDENNDPIPDFMGLEIKTQRAFSSSYITLTTKSPDFPTRANGYLVSNYGYPDQKMPEGNVLHTSFFHNSFNRLRDLWGFRLHVDRNEEKIYILVKDYRSGTVIDDDIYYNFSTLEGIIEKKLKKIAFVTARSRKASEGEEFHFQRVVLLTGFTLEKLLNLIESDYIMYDIRIGLYRSGRNVGRIHDHGSGFRIHRRNLDRGFMITQVE